MKFLAVFFSALVVVAHGKVLSQDQEELAHYAVEPQQEEHGGYDVGEVRAPEGVQVFGAAEQEAASPQESQRAYEDQSFLAQQLEKLVSDGIQIPIITRSCTDEACAYICRLLGFANGVCTNTTTCYCSN